MFFYNVSMNKKFFPVVFGLQKEEEFCKENVTFYEDIIWCNQNLSNDAKILSSPILHTYYLNKDYIFGPYIDLEVLNGLDHNDLYNILKEYQITHVFIAYSSTQDSERKGIYLELGKLRKEGLIELIYSNPKANRVNSRTLKKHTTDPVEIYELR